MQQPIGKKCGPFGDRIEHECRHWRPVMIDEIKADGVTTREEWDCAIDWPIFLHQAQAKRLRGVEGEIEAFRKNITETKPDSALGIFALSMSSLAQSVHKTIEHKKTFWRRLIGNKDT